MSRVVVVGGVGRDGRLADLAAAHQVVRVASPAGLGGCLPGLADLVLGVGVRPGTPAEDALWAVWAAAWDADFLLLAAPGAPALPQGGAGHADEDREAVGAVDGARRARSFCFG